MTKALKDPKTRIFVLFPALDQIPNSPSNQRQIIVTAFGFSALQTTLSNFNDGFMEVAAIWTAAIIVSRIPNSRAYVWRSIHHPSFGWVLSIEFLP
ncbi:hypothetical protein BDR07DRAFT_1403873 [Suillus spraguei]|nr:hypothetical protein BDR07DRAFT_1403873 [Suillus spraguei]